MIIGIDFLVFGPIFCLPFSPLVKTKAVRLSNKEEKFLLCLCISSFYRDPPQGIAATGARPVSVYTTSFWCYKRAISFCIICHLKVNNREPGLWSYMGGRIFCEEFPGREPQSQFESNNIVGCKNNIKITATVGETLNAFMAQKSKSIISC